MFPPVPALRLSARLALLLSLASTSFAAQALDIAVTKTSDSLDGSCDADCSLREAIVLANQTPGAHRIRLAAGTYHLRRPAPQSTAGRVFGEDDNIDGDLDIRAEITISGAGLTLTTINANRNDRVLDIFDGARVTVSDLTLSGGHHSDEGGAVRNHGELVLKDLRMRDNRLQMTGEDYSSVRYGGAIANYGTLSLLRCNLLYNFIAAVGLENRGGAVYNAGTLLIRDSALRANTVGNASDNYGGALFNSGTADIARTLMLVNYARDEGSSLMNAGVMKLTNSTVAGSSGGYSAALSNGHWRWQAEPVPELQLINVTVTENDTRGLVNYGRLLIRNSVVIGNKPQRAAQHDNCSSEGAAQSVQTRGLLAGINSCNAEQELDDNVAMTTVFYPLASNDSLLETYALRPNSPALDAGIGSCTSHDQRGSSRPRDGNGDGVAGCDLGAYERPAP
ncbi:choice-of-anchor Q domain-containing protein [Pseudomonas borbori]